MVRRQPSGQSNPNDVPRPPVIIDRWDVPWQDIFIARLQHLCQLQPGWDGYKARSVDFGTANFALRLMQCICVSTTPLPAIVPGIDGDLQIEWHTTAWDIEIRVVAPNVVEAWRAPAAEPDSEGESQSTTVDFTAIGSWVEKLAEPAFADLAPTA